MRRLVVLTALALMAVTIGFSDVLPLAPIVALAVLAWAVWFAMLRAERVK